MRKWVDKYLSGLADTNKKIKLIIADVGDFPEFSQRHPEQFINAGVSESNAVGVAAGLASIGYCVYIYGVSSFFLYRAYEQLKYSVSYWHKNVTFIGVGFGWKYFNIGIGHFCPDDILLVQGLPYFEIHTPYNLEQLNKLLQQPSDNPRYIRLTANIVYDDSDKYIFDSPVLVTCYGEMVGICLAAVRSLIKKGYKVGLLPFSSLDKRKIDNEIKKYVQSKFIVIEDQCELGGLYPILREINATVVSHFCLPLLPDQVTTSRNDLFKAYKLDEESISNRIIEIIEHE